MEAGLHLQAFLAHFSPSIAVDYMIRSQGQRRWCSQEGVCHKCEHPCLISHFRILKAGRAVHMRILRADVTEAGGFLGLLAGHPSLLAHKLGVSLSQSNEGRT